MSRQHSVQNRDNGTGLSPCEFVVRLRHIGCVSLAALTMSGLGACGGDDEPSVASTTATTANPAAESGEERAVRDVVQEAMTTTDPSSCTELYTRGLLEQSTGERGAAALKACRDEADKPGAKSLKIDDVRVSGPRASADIRPSGGELPFKSATLALRKSGGKWKLSRLKGGVLDRPALFAVLRRGFAEPPDAIPAPLVDCAVKDLDGESTSRLTRAYIKPEPVVFIIPVVICSTRSELQKSGVPAPVVECMTRRLRREMQTGAFGRRLAADPDAALQSDAYEGLAKRFAAACVRSTV